MNRKTYKQPLMQVVMLKMSTLVCGSVEGVPGTSSLSTIVDTDGSDTYLSRQGSLWDDEE